MLRRSTLRFLLCGALCSAGSMQAVVWDRQQMLAAGPREKRPPELTPIEGPGQDDLTPDTYLVKTPPAPKPPALPRPSPKPQPTPRPKPSAPGTSPGPGSVPTPTPPITRPS